VTRNGHQVVLVVPVTVALAVRVVLVHQQTARPANQLHGAHGSGQDALPGLFVQDDVPGRCAFRRGVLRMRAVHIEAASVGQHLVEQTVVVRPRPLALPLNLEAANVEQRVLVLVVPEDLRRGKGRIVVDQKQGIGDRVNGLGIARCDAELRLGAERSLGCHRWITDTNTTR